MGGTRPARLAELRRLRDTLERRLAVLEQKKAAYGLLLPAPIELEMQDAGRELAECCAAIARLEAAVPSARPPYLGLQAFDASNADLFFGRDRTALELAGKLQHSALLTLVGASGVGKSSIVHAGLLPMLAESTRRGGQRWRRVAITPGPRPLDALAAGLARLHKQPLDAASKYSSELARNRHRLLQLSDLLLDKAAGERLLIVIDQAEEIWTRAPADAQDLAEWAEQQQRPLLDLLAATVAGNELPAPRVAIVLVLRKEFMHHLLDHPQLGKQVPSTLVVIQPLASEDLHRAITGPAELAGCRFEAGLVNALLEDVRGVPAELPLLQYALLELWHQRSPGGELLWEAFERMGGVAGALARAAEDLLERHFAEPGQQALLRQILLRLVQPGDKTPDTRRRVSLDDLATPAADAQAVRRLLAPLERARLVVIDASDPPGDAMAELAHEALIRSWPRFHDWAEAARANLRLQLQAEDAAREWVANQCADDFLWQGRRLAQISAWRERTQPELNLRAIKFLAACRAHSTSAPQLAKRRHPQDAAQQSFLLSLQLAEQARGLASADPDLALLLAGEALARHDNATTQQAARELLAHRGVGERSVSWPAGRILRVAFGPAGETVVAVADQQAVALCDAAGQTLLELRGHAQPALGLAFSPDHQLLASASADKTARLWPRDGRPPTVLIGHTGPVTSVAFSADGTRLVSASADKTARLWDARGQLVATLSGHGAGVLKALFSPDGARLLTISDDKTARLWDSAGALQATLHGHGARLLDAAFSPDGQSIVTAAHDASARIWDARGNLQAQLHGHSGAIGHVQFVGDSNTVMSASADRTARLWSAAGAAWVILRGHTSGLTCLAYSAGGQLLATGAYDNSAIVWDRAGHARAQLRGHANAITSVQFTPNGQQLVSASLDRTVRHYLASAEALLAAISACVPRGLSEHEIARFGVPQPSGFGPRATA